jgi:oligopeptide transport system permease protein
MDTGRTTLTPDLFEPAAAESGESERIAAPRKSFLRDAWERMKRNRVATISLFGIALIFAMTFVIGPLLAQYGVYEQNISDRYQGPSAAHWFGTDELGRDMWARVWEGAKVSLFIALIATAADIGIGVVYGVISGLAGSRVDDIMQRIIEILIGIPNLIVVVLAVAILGASVLTIAIALVITGWVTMARLTRAQVLKLKEQEFFLASRSLGAGRLRLVLRHLIPNTLGPIVITLMFTIPNAIFFEAILSYIGLGIQIPEASLGSLINSGSDGLRFYPYLLWFPAAILSFILLTFNLSADGLRDAFDPRMKQ